MVLCFLSGDKKGLRDRNSPICTLSQNGYGTDQGIISMHHGLPPLPLEASPWFHLSSNIPPPHRNTDFMGSGSLPSSPAALFSIRGACSVAASYKPPMLVTRVQLPACACVAPLAGTNMSVWSMGHRLPAQRAWAMVAGLLLPTPLGWQRATHKHQYPAWTSCVSASSSVCAAGTRQNLFTGLARVLRAFLGPTATEWKYLPLYIDGVSGGKW